MKQKDITPRYVVDETGKKSGILLNVRDYKRLLAAWEEIQDSADFAAACAKNEPLIPIGELRRRVSRKS